MNGEEIIENAWSHFKSFKVGQNSKDEHGQIHTPEKLARSMVSKIPYERFENPDSTFLDPCAGIGPPFPLIVVEKLMENGISYEHAMENQIFMVELQIDNAVEIERILNPTSELNLNLKCCDSLELETNEMTPKDWNKHAFRTRYRGKDFFSYEPDPEELEKLEKVRNITDDEGIIRNFERGYDLT